MLCALAAVALLGWSFRKALFTASVRLPREFEAVVSVIEKAGEAEWMVQKTAVVHERTKGAYVLRLEKLRARRIEVFPAGTRGERLIVQAPLLQSGDLILVNPSSSREGAAIAVIGGIDETSQVKLTLDAAIAAVREANLDESMRFVSPGYADSIGFDFRTISELIAKAFKEFARPQIEIVEGPDILVRGAEAIVRGSIRLRASYRGKSGYLLGGPESSNTLWMRMEKLSGGWKLAEVRGLMPLGFDERAMKLLGAEVGLPLKDNEKQKKKEFCMPCRSKMVERFGSGG